MSEDIIGLYGHQLQSRNWKIAGWGIERRIGIWILDNVSYWFND